MRSMWVARSIATAPVSIGAVLIGAVLIGVALVVPVVPASAAGSPVSLPAKPRGLTAPVSLPTAVDPVSGYQPQVACQPMTTRAGVVKLRNLVLATYGVGRSGRTTGPCTEGVSEHADGRAWDWMVDVDRPAERAAAADFLAWLTKDSGRNARRLGVMYVIYNAKIWGVYRASDGWRPNSGHRDHVHISLSWNGARATTSFWTGRVAAVDQGPCQIFAGQYAPVTRAANTTRCPTPAALPRSTKHTVRAYGARASEVRTAQARLRVRATGVVDTATRTAAMAYQRRHDLPETGVLDEVTWASLDPSSVDKSAVKGMAWRVARRYGRDHYQQVTLSRGSAGKAVLVLQRALKMPSTSWSGWFGPATEKALKSAQASAGRRQSGVCSGADWTALARVP